MSRDRRLRARAPVGEEFEQVEDADGAVAVEVGRSDGIGAPDDE